MTVPKKYYNLKKITFIELYVVPQYFKNYRTREIRFILLILLPTWLILRIYCPGWSHYISAPPSSVPGLKFFNNEIERKRLLIGEWRWTVWITFVALFQLSPWQSEEKGSQLQFGWTEVHLPTRRLEHRRDTSTLNMFLLNTRQTRYLWANPLGFA